MYKYKQMYKFSYWSSYCCNWLWSIDSFGCFLVCFFYKYLDDNLVYKYYFHKDFRMFMMILLCPVVKNHWFKRISHASLNKYDDQCQSEFSNKFCITIQDIIHDTGPLFNGCAYVDIYVCNVLLCALQNIVQFSILKMITVVIAYQWLWFEIKLYKLKMILEQLKQTTLVSFFIFFWCELHRKNSNCTC